MLVFLLYWVWGWRTASSFYCVTIPNLETVNSKYPIVGYFGPSGVVLGNTACGHAKATGSLPCDRSVSGSGDNM